MKEWNENKLDQELEAMLEDMPQQEELEKKIEQRMKKKDSEDCMLYVGRNYWSGSCAVAYY